MVEKAYIYPRGSRRALTGLSIESICTRERIMRYTDSTFTEDRPAYGGSGYNVEFEAYRIYGPATMDDVRELREIEKWSERELLVAKWRAADYFGDPEAQGIIDWLEGTPDIPEEEIGASRSDYRPRGVFITADGRMLQPNVIDWSL